MFLNPYILNPFGKILFYCHWKTNIISVLVVTSVTEAQSRKRRMPVALHKNLHPNFSEKAACFLLIVGLVTH